MSPALTTLFGAVGTVAAVLAVLLPVILTQGASLRREIDAVRGEMGTLRANVGTLRGEVAEVRHDLHALSDRVARIEGALIGPWRPPANGGASDPVPPAVAPNPESTT